MFEFMKIFNSMSELVAYSPRQEAIIFHKGVVFPVFVDYKGAKEWTLFFPGATKRHKPVPNFQRSSYSESLPSSNVISFFDPGLMFDQSLKNTWFSGTPNIYYAQCIASFMADFFFESDVNTKDILLFASSAGGLPALKVAQSLPRSRVCVFNIQTLAFKHAAFPRMLPFLFPGYTANCCVNSFIERFDATLMDGDYKLFFFQNISDSFHFHNHYSYYRNWYRSKATKVKAEFYEYNDPLSGHGTIGRQKEIDLINEVIGDKRPSVSWMM